MAFQLVRFIPRHDYSSLRVLLPPVFTLTLRTQGGNFLWHFLKTDSPLYQSPTR